MKYSSLLVVCIAAALGASSPAFARSSGPKPLFTPSGPTYTINNGQTVGPQTVSSPYTTVVNNGTINGGASTGLTTTPTVSLVVNNGTITSNTTGVSMSGGPTASLDNTGSIIVTSTGSSQSSATGVIQTGP